MGGGEVRVGLCGWTIAMDTYVRRFPLVEVQHTFYEPSGDALLERWRRQVPSRFEFTMKAWQKITHDGSSPTYRRMKRPLPDEERAQVGSFRLTPPVLDAWRRTIECAHVLRATAVLLQCPQSFKATPSASSPCSKSLDGLENGVGPKGVARLVRVVLVRREIEVWVPPERRSGAAGDVHINRPLCCGGDGPSDLVELAPAEAGDGAEWLHQSRGRTHVRDAEEHERNVRQATHQFLVAPAEVGPAGQVRDVVRPDTEIDALRLEFCDERHLLVEHVLDRRTRSGEHSEPFARRRRHDRWDRAAHITGAHTGRGRVAKPHRERCIGGSAVEVVNDVGESRPPASQLHLYRDYGCRGYGPGCRGEKQSLQSQTPSPYGRLRSGAASRFQIITLRRK